MGISETKFPIEATSTPILQNHLLSTVIFSKAMAKMAKADKTNNNDRETNTKSTFK